MSEPATLNLSAYQGDDFEYRLQFTDADDAPLDITGWTDILAQIRRRPRSSFIADIDVTVENAGTGVVLLSVPAETMAELSGAYIWDLERTNAEGLRTIVRGRFVALGEVSRVPVS